MNQVIISISFISRDRIWNSATPSLSITSSASSIRSVLPDAFRATRKIIYETLSHIPAAGHDVSFGFSIASGAAGKFRTRYRQLNGGNIWMDRLADTPNDLRPKITIWKS